MFCRIPSSKKGSYIDSVCNHYHSLLTCGIPLIYSFPRRTGPHMLSMLNSSESGLAIDAATTKPMKKGRPNKKTVQ